MHSVREQLAAAETEAALSVDASNTFNSLNRIAVLLNVKHLCPSFSTILISTYQECSNLYIDGDVLYSREGSTQGDPLAMPFYAIATVPLINKLTSKVDQTWYVDDAAAPCTTANLWTLWDEISKIGPSYGYYAHAAKTWIVVKPDCLPEARAVFGNTNVNITYEGRPYLGAAINPDKYICKWVCCCEGRPMVKRTENAVCYCSHSTTCSFCRLYSWNHQQMGMHNPDHPKYWPPTASHAGYPYGRLLSNPYKMFSPK